MRSAVESPDRRRAQGWDFTIVRCLADKLGHEVSAEVAGEVFTINISMSTDRD